MMKKTAKDPNASLHFSAKLISDDPNNADRKFIVTFSLEDDEIKVWEVQTDGYRGGMFYKSPHYRDEGKPKFSEMFIGSTITVNGASFELLDAPDTTFERMEKQVDDFPFSDLSIIFEKLRKNFNKEKLENIFKEKCIPGTQRIKKSDYSEILSQNDFGLNKHEIITLYRRFKFYSTDTFDSGEMVKYF